ncbi:MAG: ATP-dependent sacrificial sulfur transferase LarE [Lachnospiraceae bacterium]|nr:ATP-dependent sacrificial sulfur transferase LarE [Lachnospiraceae bacterium]
MESYEEKCRMLREIMKEFTKADSVVAFSGGADSSLLLKLAVLQAKSRGTRVYAITANTELHPMNDVEIARNVAGEFGAEHLVLEVNEMENADISNNPVDRCYRCKKFLFTRMVQKAEELGAEIVMDGTNADDLLVYRPGLRAVDELGVRSPLRMAGFTKAQVRRLAEEYGISVADRPSAPCLATRFPYGDTLTMEKMKKADEGENFLKTLGLYNVRIRVHGAIARLEVDPEYMDKVLENRKEITLRLQELGYSYITLDLEGFRSGSMDIGLKPDLLNAD